MRPVRLSIASSLFNTSSSGEKILNEDGFLRVVVSGYYTYEEREGWTYTFTTASRYWPIRFMQLFCAPALTATFVHLRQAERLVRVSFAS